MSDICRMCLRNDQIKKQNIFDISLCETIYWIFGVEVEATDTFSKWICHKCLNIVNYVKKLRKFFQMNQYLLQEKKCPIDFDVEFYNIHMDVGTQTDCIQPKNSVTIKPGNFNRSANLTTLEYSPIHRSNRRIKNSLYQTRDNKSSSMILGNSTHVPIPLNVFNSLLSPNVEVPKLEKVAKSLGYKLVKPRLYKQIMKKPLIVKKELSQITKCRSVGVNTGVVYGNCILKKFDKTPKLRSVGNDTSTLNPDKISVPIDVFKKFASPYVLVDRLDPHELRTHNIAKPMKRTNPNMAYLDYYYRLPTSALKELINERDDMVSGRKKAKQDHKPLFKIEDVFHAETCDICNQVFKSKERLRMHRHIKHKIDLNQNKNEVLLQLLKYRKANKNTRSKTGEISNPSSTKEESNEEVDVITINSPLSLPFQVPEVVWFNEIHSNNLVEDDTNRYKQEDAGPSCSFGDSDDSSLKVTNLLYKINQTKYEIKIWEQMQDKLLKEFTKGTADLDKRYWSVLNRLQSNSN